MWGRLGPRFALETVFLILLAVGLGLADVDWLAVVAVMGGGWLLVSLIEVVASRRPPWPPLATPAPPPEPVVAEDTQADAVAEEPRRRWFGLRRTRPEEPELEPGAPAEPAVEPVAATPEPVAEPEPEVVPEADEGTDLDEERPRRRWFGVRRAKAEPEEPPEDTGELAVPEPPKHVRKLEAGEAAPADEPAEARAGVDAAEDR